MTDQESGGLRVSTTAVTALIFLLSFGIVSHAVTTIWLWHGATVDYRAALSLAQFIGLMCVAASVGGMGAALLVHRVRKDTSINND